MRRRWQRHFVYTFFQWNVCSSSKKRCGVWRHLYFCKIPLTKLSLPHTHSLSFSLSLFDSQQRYMGKEQQAFECNANILTHSLTLTLRKTRRLPIIKIPHAKTQWKLKHKAKRLTCETAIAQKFAQQLFIFFYMCVCVSFVFLLAFFSQIYTSPYTHSHLFSIVWDASALTAAFCVYFFSMKCV